MTFITADELCTFMNKYVDETSTMPATCCNAAMEAVKNYLGYNPEVTEYTTTARGDGGVLLALEAFPIKLVTKVLVDDKEDSVSNYSAKRNYLVHINDRFSIYHRYSVTYTAGFDDIPYIIKLTALQVASLFWESSGGNLAVSSTSFADSGTRVFNNFKMDRFLEQIQDYRIQL